MAENIFTRIGQWWDGGSAETAPAAEPEFDPDSTWDKIDGQAVGKRAGSPMQNLGTTGASTVGGFIISSERGPKLQGVERYKAYQDAINDTTIIAAGVRLFITLIKKAEWAALPAEGEEENEQAKEYAQLTYSMMFDMVSSWATLVGKTVMYRFDGFRILEWTAKRREDGAIGIERVEVRPPASIVRWDLDEGGQVRGVWQQTPTMKEVYLPREKVVYAVDDILTENPEGTGLFRHLVMTARRLKGFLELEEVGFETDLRGIPIVYAPIKALDKEVDDAGNSAAAVSKRGRALQSVKDFLKGHIVNRRRGMMLESETYRNADESQTPSSVRKWEVDLLQGESTSFEAMANAINRLNQELARVLGCEHLLLGADGAGSLALGQSKVDVLFLTVQSAQSELVEILERDWLGPIADLNGWPDELIPSLAVAELRKEDVAAIADVLLKLAQAGATLMPNDPVVAEIRERLDLPLPPEDLLEMPLEPTPEDPGSPLDQPVAKRAPTKWIRSNRSRVRQMAAERAARSKDG